jgi:hypothetical protein
MKNDQKNEMNPNMPSVLLIDVSNTTNMEPSPLVPCSDNRPEPGKRPRIISRSVCNVYCCIRPPLAQHTAMACVVLHCLLCIYCFFPLFSPVDSATDDAAEYDYAPDDQSFSAELPGKQNPLDHSYIAYSLSIMLALDFATVLASSHF